MDNEAGQDRQPQQPGDGIPTTALGPQASPARGKSWLEQALTVAKGLGALGNGPLFIVAIFQLWMMQQALDLTKIEQRPWIPPPKSVVGFYKDGGPIKMDFVFSNAGKLPTKKFAVDGVVADGEAEWLARAREVCDRLIISVSSGQNTYSAVPDADWKVPLTKMPSGKLFPYIEQVRSLNEPYFAGCAVYTFAGDKMLHRTGFGVRLNFEGGKIIEDGIYATDAD